RDRIESWVDERLRRRDVVGRADPSFLPSPVGSSIIARWTWMQSRLVRTCLVAADPFTFLERPENARQGTLNIDRETHSRARGGAYVSLNPGCRKLYVTVWPVVDLGWVRKTGPPLKVGPYLLKAGPYLMTEPLSHPNILKTRSWTRRLQRWIEKLLNS